MLSQADVDIEYTMSELSQYGLEAGYLVPTVTGLRKSILDAHESLRAFLRNESIHNFLLQGQGVEQKVVMPAEVRTVDGVTSTQVSFYRPDTKSGDPRVWIYGLPQIADPGNVLVFLPKLRGQLQILIVSGLGLDDVSRPETPIGEAVAELAVKQEEPARDLLAKLRSISNAGFVPSLRSGSTGIGYTLETMLDIAANSSKSPDYRGIEIKASRTAPSGKGINRVNLFAKTPDWKTSRLKSARDLLSEFGYLGDQGLPRLYVTVRDTPNLQGLYFTVPREGTLACGNDIGVTFRPALIWPMSGLEAALTAKHRQTFWVEASVQEVDGREYFHYQHVTHSREPLAANFAPLILNGTISMDFTVKEKPDGRMRDHGYLFKIFPESRHLLIPNEVHYALSGS